MKYPKIQTIWKRESEKPCRIIPGEFSRLEFETVSLWHVTEKIDGMNMRVIWDGSNAEYRGRTDRAQIPPGLLAWLDENLSADKLAEKFPGSVILFGEGYGAGIQKGGSYSQDQKFVLFDVYVDGWWLEPHNVEDVAASLEIDSVPSLGTYRTVNALLRGTIAESVFVPGAPMEGVVCRSVPTLFNRKGERVMWKIKRKDYRQLEAK